MNGEEKNPVTNRDKIFTLILFILVFGSFFLSIYLMLKYNS